MGLSNKRAMNFRQKFEAWHLARFGYVAEPIKPFTAMNCKYQPGAQQYRWEGWQACNTQSFEDGRKHELRDLLTKFDTVTSDAVPISELMARLEE